MLMRTFAMINTSTETSPNDGTGKPCIVCRESAYNIVGLQVAMLPCWADFWTIFFPLSVSARLKKKGENCMH